MFGLMSVTLVPIRLKSSGLKAAGVTGPTSSV